MTEGLLILIWKKNMADVEKKKKEKKNKKNRDLSFFFYPPAKQTNF